MFVDLVLVFEVTAGVFSGFCLMVFLILFVFSCFLCLNSEEVCVKVSWLFSGSFVVFCVWLVFDFEQFFEFVDVGDSEQVFEVSAGLGFCIIGSKSFSGGFFYFCV